MGLFSKIFGKDPKDVFAKQLLAEIKKVNAGMKLVYDREAFSLRGEGSDVRVNLANIFHEHQQLPEEDRKGNLVRLANIFGRKNEDLPDDFDVARSHLRPKVYARATVVNLDMEAKLSGNQPLDMPQYPLGEHLVLSLAYDEENAIRSINRDNLKTWGINYYEAMEQAVANLDESTVAFASLGETVHISISGDNFDSSRVTLIDRITQFEVRGQHVAMVPQRDCMVIVGSESIEDLTAMLAITDKAVSEDTRPLSSRPLILVDGEWEDWVVPPEHPLYLQFHALEVRMMSGLYAEQRVLLEQVVEREFGDVFVASYSAYSKESNEFFSMAVWGEGVDSLLPKTDLISFCSASSELSIGDSEVTIVKWEVAAEIVGDLLDELEEFYPRRFRVRQYPSAEQMERLKKQAVSL